jgi:hypothetical protein
MGTWVWIVIAIAVVLAIAAAWIVTTRQRTARLRERFGPEYERAVEDREDTREAEAELRERVKRREQLEIRPLPAEARDRYVDQWKAVQAEFVDDPATAIREADRLVSDLMRERGYPMDDFEQRAADISVDYPVVVENYRAGHATYLAHDRGESDTEDLRQAVVHYRSLFAELLGSEEARADETVEEAR